MLITFGGFDGELNKLREYYKEHPDEFPNVEGCEYRIALVDDAGKLVQAQKHLCIVDESPHIIPIQKDLVRRFVTWPL